MIISVDNAGISNIISGLSDASTNIQRRTLASVDNETTIIANINAKFRFSDSQNAHMSFTGALSKSSAQLESISSTLGNLDRKRSRSFT